MTTIECKSCGQSRYVKSGTVRGNQRYLCQNCGCNFTVTTAKGKQPPTKTLSVLLYAGKASPGMIARLLGISHAAVCDWVRKQMENTLEPPSVNASEGPVNVDEMWHFVDGIKTRLESGTPSILWRGEPWPGSWMAVMAHPDINASTTAESKDAVSWRTTGQISDASSHQLD